MRLILMLLLTCGVAAGFNAESRSSPLAFDACGASSPTPTPQPSPSLEPRSDDIVSVMGPSVVIGAPGETVTLKGSLTNTTSETYAMIGYGFVGDGKCVGGNTPECPILALTTRLSTDPIAAHGSTGEVDIADFQLNPAYTGPLPTVIKFTFYTTKPGIFTGITTFSVRVQPHTDASRPPLLFTDPCTQRAAALDSATLTGEPFGLTNSLNLGPDQQTRLMLFAWNMNLQPGEGAAAVTVEAVDTQQVIHPLPVEFVSDVAGEPGLTQIVVRLPGDLPLGGDLRLRILVHEFTSNEAPLSIKPN